MPRIVITGGPGAGKTSLLHELARRGFRTVAESARAAIAERRALGLPPRPAPEMFAREILRRDIEKYEQAGDSDEWVFFDRSALESLAMLHETVPYPPDQLSQRLAEFRFHPFVFMLPPWQAIYVTDSERDQTFAHSQVVHAQLVRWYQRCGYQLQEVPCLPVAERAGFVVQALRCGDA
ncbi:MAG: AAA family ATPase [Rubrivivax sp.]